MKKLHSIITYVTVFFNFLSYNILSSIWDVISRLFGQKKESDGKRLSAFCFYSALITGLMIAVLILVGFSFGVQPLIGYNYGAKNYTRIKSILKFAFLFEGTLALILTLVLSIPAKGILSCITDDTQLITIGVSMLRYQLISMVFVSIILICISTFQSSGKAWSAFLLSISRQGIIFAIVIFIVSHVFGYTGILASQAIADILTAILAIILLRRVFLSLPRSDYISLHFATQR